MGIVLIVFVIIVIFIGVISNISKLEFPTTDVVIKRKGKEGENIDIDNSHIDIIYYFELVDVINDKLKDVCHFLRVGEYNSLCIKLEKFVNVSDEVKQKHDNYIKENYG